MHVGVLTKNGEISKKGFFPKNPKLGDNFEFYWEDSKLKEDALFYLETAQIKNEHWDDNRKSWFFETNSGFYRLDLLN